jgi:hypothetical protein
VGHQVPDDPSFRIQEMPADIQMHQRKGKREIMIGGNEHTTPASP